MKAEEIVQNKLDEQLKEDLGKLRANLIADMKDNENVEVQLPAGLVVKLIDGFQ